VHMDACSVVDVRLATNQAKNANAATVTSFYFGVVWSSVFLDFITYTLKTATRHIDALCVHHSIINYGQK
jgi:hypothetical protein